MRRKWKRMLWYNQRSLLFVVVICVGGLALSSLLLDLFLVGYGNRLNNLKDYFQCLLTTPIQSGMDRSEMETFPQELCGIVDEEGFTDWSRFYYSVWYIQVSSSLSFLYDSLIWKVVAWINSFDCLWIEWKIERSLEIKTKEDWRCKRGISKERREETSPILNPSFYHGF